MNKLPNDLQDRIREMRKHNVKYICQSMIEVYNLLNSTSALVDISLMKFSKGLSILRKDKNKYVIEIETKENLRKYFKRQLQVEMEIQNDSYIGKNGIIISEIPQISKPNLKYTIALQNITKGNQPKKSYYRMIIPTDKTILTAFFLPVQSFNYENASALGMIKTNIDESYYDIYEVSYSNDKYLLIDCNDIIEASRFYDQTISILISLGFITSHFIQNECYILSSKTLDFKHIEYIEYKSLRESISLPFNFLDSNSYNHFEIQEAEEHMDEMPFIAQKHLDNLFTLCYQNLEIQNCLFVFISSSNYPLDTQPACLSVAMEGICNFIMQKNTDVVNPVKDKLIFKEIKKELLATLEKYKSKVDNEGYSILKIKIENINSPTNQEKLTKPFNLLGIKLKKYEKVAIGNRNNFLHSRIEYEIGREIRNKSSIAFQLFFTTSVLSRLFFMLILKLIDYDGNIVNNLKSYEHIFGDMPDENILISL
jgi:hypothetical protein